MAGGLGALDFTSLPTLASANPSDYLNPNLGLARNAVTLPQITADVPQAQAGSGQMTDQQALIASAKRLGLAPEEWGGLMHFESGMDPSRWGGTGGRHVGVIQFGPAEQKQFGVTGKESFQEQLPKAEAFLQARGYQPGMGLAQAYSTINAGSPNMLNASDAKNGGTWGSVADKVNYQFGPHIAAATKFLGGTMQMPASAGGAAKPAGFSVSGPTQGAAAPAAGATMAMPQDQAPPAIPDSLTSAIRSMSGMGGGAAGQGGQDQGQQDGAPRPFSPLPAFQPHRFSRLQFGSLLSSGRSGGQR